MCKIVAAAILSLVLLSSPAFAVLPSMISSEEPGVSTPGNDSSGECPSVVKIWDTGMADTFTPPTGCPSDASVGCFVNADTTGTGGFGQPGDRLLADDWLSVGTDVVGGVKVWMRVNAAAEELGYAGDTPEPMLKGFCVKFYEAKDFGGAYPWCPDGSVAGEGAIGTLVYDEYSSMFDIWNVTTGVPSQYAYCVRLTHEFEPAADKWYWVSVSPDFDFHRAPSAGKYSQMFWQLYSGLGISGCEAAWFDGWTAWPRAAWTPVSSGIGFPCWAGWDAAFSLYGPSGIPVGDTGGPERFVVPSTWGRIKASYH